MSSVLAPVSTPDVEGQPTTRFKVVKIDQRSTGGKSGPKGAEDGQIHELRLMPNGQKSVTYKRGRWTIIDFYDPPPIPPSSIAGLPPVTVSSNPPSNSNSTPSTPTPHVPGKGDNGDGCNDRTASPPPLVEINPFPAFSQSKSPITVGGENGQGIKQQTELPVTSASQNVTDPHQQQQVQQPSGTLDQQSQHKTAGQISSSAKNISPIQTQAQPQTQSEQVTSVHHVEEHTIHPETTECITPKDINSEIRDQSETESGNRLQPPPPVPPSTTSSSASDEIAVLSSSKSGTSNSGTSSSASPSDSDLTTLASTMVGHQKHIHHPTPHLLSHAALPLAGLDVSAIQDRLGVTATDIAAIAQLGNPSGAVGGVGITAGTTIEHEVVQVLNPHTAVHHSENQSTNTEANSGYATPASIHSAGPSAMPYVVSSVAIDNKIEQAMDLVKTHLMYAVREEVEVLKEKIVGLLERIQALETENAILKQSHQTQNQMGQQSLQQMHTPSLSSPTSEIVSTTDPVASNGANGGGADAAANVPSSVTFAIPTSNNATVPSPPNGTTNNSGTNNGNTSSGNGGNNNNSSINNNMTPTVTGSSSSEEK